MVIAYSDCSKIDENRIVFVGALSANYSVTNFKSIFLSYTVYSSCFCLVPCSESSITFLWDIMSVILNDTYLLILFLKGIMKTLNIFYRLSC